MTVERQAGQLLPGPALNGFHREHRADLSEGEGDGGLEYQMGDPAYATDNLASLPMQKGDCVVFSFHTVNASGRFAADDAARGSVPYEPLRCFAVKEWARPAVYDDVSRRST
jgi:hypothetical protein